MIIYDDLDDFRKIYTYHCKKALENNEIVLISSTFETTDKIKSHLKSAGVNVLKHVLDGSLLIVDSMRSYHVSDVKGLVKLIDTVNERAQREGKSGILCFADIGTFFLLEKTDELINYESSNPKKLDTKTRVFCCYHKAQFATLSKGQKQRLLECHNRIL
jgi:hypothetical protein